MVPMLRVWMVMGGTGGSFVREAIRHEPLYALEDGNEEN